MKKVLFSLIGCMIFSFLSAQTNLNIITFNIRYANNQDTGYLWPDRRENVAMIPLFHQAGILCTQEVLQAQKEDLLHLLPGWKVVGVGRDDGKQAGEYSAIFYDAKRFLPVKDGHFWLSENPDKPALGWDAACIRICTWICLKEKSTGKQFFVFNTHFDHVGKIAQANSARLILNKINQIAKGNYPVILTGDFNMTPDNEAIRLIKQKLSDSRDVTQLPPYGPEGTFNNFKFDTSTKERIDYVFVNKKVTVARYGVLTDSKDNKFFSDHLPVLVGLKF